MSNILGLTIESLVSVLLLLTILYCVRLNTGLKQLKADERTMKNTIAELVLATESAERAISGLKMTVRESDAGLSEKLKEAQRLSSGLTAQMEQAKDVVGRVTRIAEAGRAPSASIEPKAEIKTPPDANALAAAAQAIAARANARVNGQAA